MLLSDDFVRTDLSIGGEVAVGGDIAVEALMPSYNTAAEDGQRQVRRVTYMNFVGEEPCRGT